MWLTRHINGDYVIGGVKAEGRQQTKYNQMHISSLCSDWFAIRVAGYLFLEHIRGTPEIRFLSNKSNLLDVIAFLPVSRIRDLTFPGPPHSSFRKFTQRHLCRDIKYINPRVEKNARRISLSEMTIEEINCD